LKKGKKSYDDEGKKRGVEWGNGSTPKLFWNSRKSKVPGGKNKRGWAGCWGGGGGGIGRKSGLGGHNAVGMGNQKKRKKKGVSKGS